jgi:PAS domain S-box-containing protein
MQDFTRSTAGESRAALRIVIIYAVFGLLWIFFSDQIAGRMAPDLQTLVGYGSIKGALFILLTALLLYLLLKRSLNFAHASEERYRDLFEINPHPMWVYDLETLSFLAVNDAAITHYGYSRTEFLAMTIKDIRPPEDIPALLENINKVNDGVDEAGVWQHLKKDGSVIAVEITSHVTTFNGRRSEMVLAHDVTAQLRATQELKEAHRELLVLNRIITACTDVRDMGRLFRTLLQEITEITGLEGGMICLLQEERHLRLVAHRGTSPKVVEALSSTPIGEGECLCSGCSSTGHPIILSSAQEIRAHTAVEAILQEDLTYHAAFPLLASGNCVGTLCLFTRNAPPPSPKLLALLETVTAQIAIAIKSAHLYQESINHSEELERRVMERTRELAAANQELESFSFSVSHDLRAPLVILDGYAQALQEDFPEQLSSKMKEYLEGMQRASRRMAQQIEAMLSLSRVSRAELRHEVVNLSDMALEIMANLRKGDPERQVELHIAPKALATGDARLLQLVMENLLGNAWKYSAKKSVAVIEFGVQQEGEQRLYFVRDNGAGFDMSQAGKLFAPFQRLHRQDEFSGTGIGLATVQRIIHRHGGSIHYSAKPDQGATFSFTLGGYEQ